MNNESEQSVSIDIEGAAKAWTVPNLEKVEINETASGAQDVGTNESTFPFLNPS